MAESIVFNGVTFRRYPGSPHISHRRYFSPGPHDAGRGVEALHREIWKSVHGPIPAGHHIHHRDGDPLNNDVGNLECVSIFEHRREHRDAHRTPEQLEHLSRVQPLAAEWHASPEGIAWHREAGRKSWEARPLNSFTCTECSRVFTSRNPTATFCGDTCGTRSRRRRRRAAAA